MFSDDHTQQTALASARKVLAGEPSDIELRHLVTSEEALVRAAAAEHPRTSILALLRLAEDEVTSVRTGVARNPRTDIPEDLHERLAADPTFEVRFALATNPVVPAHVLSRLSRSRDKDVAIAARSQMAEMGGARGLLARMALPRG